MTFTPTKQFVAKVRWWRSTCHSQTSHYTTRAAASLLNGTASGSLYLDDGVSLEQAATSYIQFYYNKKGVFSMTGTFGYGAGVNIESVIVLGSKPGSDEQVLIHKPIPLSGEFALQT
jgi:hypothetical protein